MRGYRIARYEWNGRVSWSVRVPGKPGGNLFPTWGKAVRYALQHWWRYAVLRKAYPLPARDHQQEYREHCEQLAERERIANEEGDRRW